MRNSFTTLLAVALAATGVLSAPTSTPDTIAQRDGAMVRLTSDGLVQHLAPDGSLLGQTKLSVAELDKFKALTTRGQSRPREDNVFAKKACVFGAPCQTDGDCWQNGCDGCMFLTTSSGFCYGTSW